MADLAELEARITAARAAKDWLALRSAEAAMAAACGLSPGAWRKRGKVDRAARDTTLEAHGGDPGRAQAHCLDQARHCERRAARIRHHAMPGDPAALRAARIKDLEAARWLRVAALIGEDVP